LELVELDELKEKLLIMGSRAEAAVNRAIKALLRRDDELARRTREEDQVIDHLEMEIDDAAFRLLAGGPTGPNLRLIAMTMKIAHELERVGDEATTISRRCLELSREPQLRQQFDIPAMATLALLLLKDALDAFVNRDPAKARTVIERDEEVDELNRRLHRELAGQMAAEPQTISRCLNLMVVAKSLERIGDHATNVAEDVIFILSARDVRHQADSPPSRRP
jgi:phosphate transport system protein